MTDDPHAACCRAISVRLRDDLAGSITADAHIGNAIRQLLQPGVKRRTYRRDELQAIVDAADTKAGER